MEHPIRDNLYNLREYVAWAKDYNAKGDLRCSRHHSMVLLWLRIQIRQMETLMPSQRSEELVIQHVMRRS